MTADTVGGVWTYSLELCRALVAQGLSVALATMGPRPDAAQRRAAALLPGVDLFESEFKLEWMEDPWHDVAEAGDWLLSIAESWKPDLVHINGYAHANLRWRRPVVLVAHSCVCSWWKAVLHAPTPPEWNHYVSAVKLGLRAAEVVVAPSRAMLVSLAEHYGPLAHGRVIWNGLSESTTAQPGHKEDIVFAAGRLWDRAKNIHALSRAAASARWPVIVAGDDDPNGSSAEAPNIRALGRLAPEDVCEWMRRAAIYAFPAKYEPFGLSILEAAQAGCALVLGDIPSLREIWGDAAIFVRPEDSERLAGVLNGLASDPAALRELGARARKATGGYTVEAMCQGYLAAYSDACASYALHVQAACNGSALANDGPVPIKQEASCAS